MNREQKRQLNVAYKKVREITGFHTDDEKQIIVGNTNYAFRKQGKAWILFETLNFDEVDKKVTKPRRARNQSSV